MKALIDADLVAYRCAAAAENDSEGIASHYIDRLVEEIITQTEADEFTMYLSGAGNFRNEIYPEYKANRLKMEKPKHLAFARSHIQEMYNTVISEGCEADDLMGIAQMETYTVGWIDNTDTTICSLDKDLLMIPGNHFSWQIAGKSKNGPWVKEAVFRFQSDLDALRHFYTQLIVGDVADNLKGVVGLGKAAASKMLDHLDNEKDMFDAVREAYGNDDDMLMQGQCLWIQRKPNDRWKGLFETK